MSVILPPGQTGLEGEVAALKQQVAELSRRGTHMPVCAVNLITDAGIPHMTDAVMVGGWGVLSDVDNMWTSNTSSYVTIPFAGRWSVIFHVAWEDYCFGQRCAKIMKNSFTVSATSVIGSDIRMASGDPGISTEGTINHAHVENEVFAAGDKLYFSVYQRNSGNAGTYGGDGRTLNILKGSSTIEGRTSITVRYIGPN